MKVYQIFLDDEAGWITNNPNDFCEEIECAYFDNRHMLKKNMTNYIKGIISNIEKLKVGESYRFKSGDYKYIFKCFDKTQEEYDNLNDFIGW
jgi:hypothetical protein